MRTTVFSSLAALVALAAMFYGCGGTSEQQSDATAELQPLTEAELANGLKLANQYCFTCHTPGMTPARAVAPGFEAVKEAYWGSNASRTEFVAAMSGFLASPSAAASKMPEAVEKFGLMANLGLPEKDMQAIAAFMFETDLSKPDWHKQADAAADQAADTDYLALGQQYALQTKAQLGKNLLGAIKAHGTEYAIGFCNERALHLTDSMANELGVTIQRVSDKNRNPLNAATKEELETIALMKQALANGEKPKPVLQDLASEAVGYYPIVTNDMCLQCHGTAGTQVAEGTMEKINGLYPEDLATGYGSNELRGMWRITMPKK